MQSVRLFYITIIGILLVYHISIVKKFNIYIDSFGKAYLLTSEKSYKLGCLEADKKLNCEEKAKKYTNELNKAVGGF